MKKNGKKIEFRISTSARIELTPFRPIQKIDSDEIFSAELFCNGTRFFIFDDGNYSSGALHRIDVLVGKALAGKLETHTSIVEDLGFMWNEKLEATSKKINPEKFVYDFNIEGQRSWVGLRYYLWSSTDIYQTCWLYAKQDKFFLELTTTYPWALCEPEPDEVVVPYEEFMKNYKPILILEIPREALVRWKRQTSRLMKVVASNEKRVRQRWFALRRHHRLLRIRRLTLTRRRSND